MMPIYGPAADEAVILSPPACQQSDRAINKLHTLKSRAVRIINENSPLQITKLAWLWPCRRCILIAFLMSVLRVLYSTWKINSRLAHFE